MAARTGPLRVVKPGEQGKPARRSTKKPLGVKAAAEAGDRRQLLVALRARIAQAVEDPKTLPRDLAALSRRLLEIAKEVEAIDADTEGDDIGTAAATPDEEWAAT